MSYTKQPRPNDSWTATGKPAQSGANSGFDRGLFDQAVFDDASSVLIDPWVASPKSSATFTKQALPTD